MIHPQKRNHVRKVLELVIRRVIELKHDLVKWNPPNAYVRIPQGQEEAFPWEYIHLDDILVDLKLSPETLEIPVPKYFREDNLRKLEQRDRQVSGYMRLHHNTDEIFIEDHFDSVLPIENMTIDRAIEIIQRNERGRQGMQRAILVKDLREKERQGRMYDASAQIEMDSDIAATNLQRMFRGYLSRNAAAHERENELVFVGMRPKRDNVDLLENEQLMAYRKRKQEQMENKQSYDTALERLKEIILDEEGPEKREELREERTLWVTDQISQEKFPENLDDFYAAKQAPDPQVEASQAKESTESKKGGSKEDKTAKSSKGEAKGKGGGKGKAVVEEPDPSQAMPKLQGKTELTEAMFQSVQYYEETWENKDESDNFQQKHDVELGKMVVRPMVIEEIRAQVDSMLIMNLRKIKMQIAPGKDKKKKGKKGKKKGKKGKKDKKRKPLPGEKLSELKGLDADHMLSMLIEHQLVVRSRGRMIRDLVGDFNYLGSMHHSAERKDEGTWTPQDPSMAQIRQSVTEYCVLPNGSADIKAGLKPECNIKAVMLFGPSGSGKTLMVEAVASELGALLIHLTPDKLRGVFSGKQGATKLVHMVMTVARDPSMQPVVIYLDECEQFFVGGKKSKTDKDGPARFKKDLLLYKNLALTQEHRVVILGTSKQPELADQKDLKAFFDRFLYLPYPDYSSRVLVWRHYLTTKITEAYSAINATDNKIDPTKPNQAGSRAEAVAEVVKDALDTLDLSSLAHISEGYSAGAIARTVRTIITVRRVMMLRSRPLMDIDFIDNLSVQEVTYQDDRLAFMAFIRAISGLEERRKKIEVILAGALADGKDDKKKGRKNAGKPAKKK